MAFELREDRKERPEPAERKLQFDVNAVEEALDAASQEWGLPRELLRAEVVGSERGFLGLFGNRLKVEVTPTGDLLGLKGTAFLNDLMGRMDLDAQASLTEDGTIDIEGPDAMDCVVGQYGDALKAMEYLLNLALRDPSLEPRVRVDSCGYRKRRTRSLERLAEATARQVAEYGRPVRLDPMLSWERWVIHTTLQDNQDVRTESVGEPPMRKVVVLPRFDASESMGRRYASRPRPPRRRPY